MYSLNTAFANCWIGLNDLETEGTWVWADGDNSTFRYWGPGEPNNDLGVQDCGCTWTHNMVDDCNCVWIFTCYFCSRVGELLRILMDPNSFYMLPVLHKLLNFKEFLDNIILDCDIFIQQKFLSISTGVIHLSRYDEMHRYNKLLF